MLTIYHFPRSSRWSCSIDWDFLSIRHFLPPPLISYLMRLHASVAPSNYTTYIFSVLTVTYSGHFLGVHFFGF